MGVMRQGAKWTAASVDLVRRPPPGLVVLIYHRVGRRSPIEVDLPLALFEEQMAWLAGNARVLTLDEAVAQLGEAPPPSSRSGSTGSGSTASGPTRPSVVVTFDDGTQDFASDALGVLVTHRVPATLYVSTAFVEERRSFPDDGAPISWSALGEAVSTGLVTVGSHTHTHALLDRVEPQEAAEELDRSIELIGERLGVRADHFAYPKAVPPGAAVEEQVRARFASAALAGTRPNVAGVADPHRLWRSPIQVADGMRFFRRKVRGGMGAEDSLRTAINLLRYRGATN